MAVYTIEKKGGFNPFKPLGILASLIPGGQALSPWLMGASAVTNAVQGKPAEAAADAAGLVRWDGFRPKNAPPSLNMGNAFRQDRPPTFDLMRYAPWAIDWNRTERYW